MHTLKARWIKRLREPCDCRSGRPYRSCCCTRESLEVVALGLFVFALLYGASFDRSVALLIVGAAVASALLLFVARPRR